MLIDFGAWSWHTHTHTHAHNSEMDFFEMQPNDLFVSDYNKIRTRDDFWMLMDKLPATVRIRSVRCESQECFFACERKRRILSDVLKLREQMGPSCADSRTKQHAKKTKKPTRVRDPCVKRFNNSSSSLTVFKFTQTLLSTWKLENCACWCSMLLHFDDDIIQKFRHHSKI